MDIWLATLGPRRTRKHASAEDLLLTYRDRIGHFCRCDTQNYATEEKFFGAIERGSASGPNLSRRTVKPQLILLDGRGRAFSTEQFAQWLCQQRDQATQRLIFAVGPADGWSEAARARAGLLLSLGPLTLPHELAAVVLAEQIYRAFTIIEGHPYHLGHAGG